VTAHSAGLGHMHCGCVCLCLKCGRWLIGCLSDTLLNDRHSYLSSFCLLSSLSLLSLSFYSSLFLLLPCSDELDATGDETDSMLARREEEEDVNVGDEEEGEEKEEEEEKEEKRTKSRAKRKRASKQIALPVPKAAGRGKKAATPKGGAKEKKKGQGKPEKAAPAPSQPILMPERLKDLLFLDPVGNRRVGDAKYAEIVWCTGVEVVGLTQPVTRLREVPGLTLHTIRHSQVDYEDGVTVHTAKGGEKFSYFRIPLPDRTYDTERGKELFLKGTRLLLATVVAEQALPEFFLLGRMIFVLRPALIVLDEAKKGPYCTCHAFVWGTGPTQKDFPDFGRSSFITDAVELNGNYLSAEERLTYSQSGAVRVKDPTVFQGAAPMPELRPAASYACDRHAKPLSSNPVVAGPSAPQGALIKKVGLSATASVPALVRKIPKKDPSAAKSEPPSPSSSSPSSSSSVAQPNKKKQKQEAWKKKISERGRGGPRRSGQRRRF